MGSAPRRGRAPGGKLARTGPVVRTSSGDQVALYIRRLIFDGELRPGERVPQDEIAGALGVSRIPVREALIALEREGWVHIELHRGAFINPLDPMAVRDSYELYGMVFGFAATKAIERVGDERGDLVAKLNGLAKALAASTDPLEFGELTVAFQRTLIDAASSHRVNVLLRAMSSVVPGDFYTLVPRAMDAQRRAFSTIARHVKNGAAEQAVATYAKMMHAVGELVVTLFAERGLFDEPAERGSRTA